jgi:hypothetical protein
MHCIRINPFVTKTSFLINGAILEKADFPFSTGALGPKSMPGGNKVEKAEFFREVALIHLE